MARFEGIFDAPDLQVAPCGLLSVAGVVTSTDNPNSEAWIRGFDTLTNSSPTIRILSNSNAAVSNGTIFDGSAVPAYYSTEPFYVEIETKNTGQNLMNHNPFDGYILTQLEAASQKAAEYELWMGQASKALTPAGTGYLTEAGKATTVTTGGSAPDKALALLEQGIADSPTGARGVIHMTRDVASVLGSKLMYEADSQLDDEAYAVTRLGTSVVIGSGYTGSGPTGTTGAAATATNKWMFATGSVGVVLGEARIDNESLAQGFSPATNDSIVKASRPVAVRFDPSIWLTAQVTLP